MGHQQPPYGYRDFTSGHNFVDDTGITHELFGLQAGMEMLAMPSRDFFSKPGHEAGSGSSSIMMMSSDGTDCWQQSMIIDDLFPNSQVSNEEQRRGLSLSLPNQFGLLKSSSYSSSNNNNNNNYHQFSRSYQVRESVFLKPTQELLNEFCKFGGDGSSPVRRQKSRKEDEDGEDYSASLMSMGGLELQRRKAKLISMLEEVCTIGESLKHGTDRDTIIVRLRRSRDRLIFWGILFTFRNIYSFALHSRVDRRYKMYCEQMRGVVSSFEAVAGEGSAAVYSALALKAMSRHFRCLRDGIVGQIRATKKAMGDKDQVAPAGTTKGETPRLKMLDQCIRQRKAFQMGGVESQPWRPQRGLPERSVSILRAWLFEHFLHPYPSDMDKHILARQTGLSRSQVSNWFINARVRLWKPMVEEMYTEETKEHDINCDSDHNNQPDCENPNPNSVTIATTTTTTNSPQDQKPEIHVELDSLSSIVGKRRTDNFGVVDLDFASYNRSSSSSNQGGFGQGVSLTLGLQQHSGGGMSLSFSPASQQSLFFAREQMEEEQNLPCRNLMAAQLLHNLAG